ncbi:MAG: Tol-Pal system beta propeller repeat protein TolB [Candidatus Eisenbacteria bacterium]
MRYTLILAVLVVFAGATASHSETDVHIKVTTEGAMLIRIGFVGSKQKLKGDLANYNEEFLKTLKSDLDISGYFEIVRDIEADLPHALIEVLAEGARTDLSFDIDLRDRASTQSIFKRRYGASPTGIVMVAHVVADDIVYALTGRTGIANTRLAFVAGEKGSSYLYSIHIDGSQLVKLTKTPSIVMSPSWSPEGKRVAYVSYEGGNSAVYVIDAGGRSKTRFASFEGMNATPAWSPDGDRIAVTLSKDGNPEVYILSLDGTTRKRITYFSGIDCSPTWAPNGLELAFTSDRAGTPQVFVTDTEGLSMRRVTYEGSYNTSPAWSPEGDLIAYVSRIDGRFQICTVDPFGITTQVLTDAGSNEDPSWSPDGMHIVFSSTRRGNSSIYIMNKDGSAKRRIVDGMNLPRNPAWASEPRHERTSQAQR